MKPTVSICIATYNQDLYIKDCIMSVLSQSLDVSIEILIGDDSSNLKTSEIVSFLLKSHPNSIKYFKHVKNLGASENYQFLINQASGYYIAHLDGDDFWLPGKLKAQVNWLEHHPNSIACYTNAVVVNELQEVKGVFSSPVNELISFTFLLEKGNFLNHSSMIYKSTHKRIILDFINPFIDYKIHLNFAKISDIGFINSAFVVYRQNTTHSMLKNTPNVILNLYFDTIVESLSDSLMSKKLRQDTIKYFWKSILIDGLIKMRFKWTIDWAKKIKHLYPDEFISIMTSGAFLAFKNIIYLSLIKINKLFFSKNYLKVLHER